MPFEIVRNDIVNMKADAIVNTANPQPVVGSGCDAGIHKAAGPELLEARKKIGPIPVGSAAATPAFGLNANYVIHAVGPVWQDGAHGEEALLRQCYDAALALAWELGCTSIAFPLLSAGNYGFPKPVALQIAISAFSGFLMDHEMQISLAVFSRESFALSEKLFRSVESYIDEHYVRDRYLDEYGREGLEERRSLRSIRAGREFPTAGEDAVPEAVGESLDRLLEETDAGFSETLLKLIDRTGKKDPEVYKRANVDRKLFSKIRNNPHYQPSKTTALAFAVALELTLEETCSLIGRAGFALTHSSKLDIIVEYFIREGNYDLFELNEVLFAFGQPILGG